MATFITAQSVIPAKAGIQEGTGFRVKPGMTHRTERMSLCLGTGQQIDYNETS